MEQLRLAYAGRDKPQQRRPLRGWPRRISQSLLEKVLQGAGWPYVAVDEAKKAIFADSDIDSFDFIVYQEHGPCLLIETGPRNAASIETMADWQQVFGPDFVSVFARTRASGRIAFVRADTGKEISDELDLVVPPAAAL